MAGRLIDADKLKAHYSWWKGGTREMTMDEAKSDFDCIIDLQPTVEVEPTKHGRWLYREEHFPFEKEPRITAGCSECGHSMFSKHDTLNYCPNCGARMDEIGEDKSHPFAESVMMGMDGGENEH